MSVKKTPKVESVKLTGRCFNRHKEILSQKQISDAKGSGIAICSVCGSLLIIDVV